MLNGRYFNRDLSWIDFNHRVLEEGLRGELAPLERFRFLSIVSSNFDEFFMVRVAAVKRALRSGGNKPDPSGLSPAEQLKKISEKVRFIISRQYACLLDEIFPALAQGGLELLRPDSYTRPLKDYLESFFMTQIYPVLTPLRIEGDEPLPSIDSFSMNVAFLLVQENSGLNGPAGEYIAMIQIPPGMNRIIWLPEERAAEKNRRGLAERPAQDIPAQSGRNAAARWALLDDLLSVWGGRFFPGLQVKETMLFKVNRDADFSVDEQRDEDFIEAMEEVLESREKSRAVRMVYSPGSPRLRDELARRLSLDQDDLYGMEGPLNLGNLLDLANAPDFDHLREKPRRIYPSPAFSGDEPVWDRINRGDVMIRLPYQSFDPVIRFFQEAAADPQVLSIKTALYRTSGNSPVVRALEEAALNGKHVTALVELKARFDEERNISWANRLEKAGVIVVYGLARLKVHAKIALVVRRENDRIKRYIHLSTGNYNDKTARLYEDIGLFTCREDIAFDAGLLFNMITGYSAVQPMRKLVIAPTGLKRRLLELIERETKRSGQEYPGKIMAKVNALVDTDIIGALYQASQAGVKVLLNVRGICALVPGAPGLSENIRVVSIIDRYLEHSRLFYFANGGAEEVYLSSADWMPRNLDRRIELMFPVLQDDIRLRLRDSLELYFRDNCQARILGSDGAWTRLSPAPGEAPFRIQEYLLAQAAAECPETARTEFVVRRSPPSP
ncbi:MAG: polyphosphate kinase 1 [Treponema sp.]|jgi:polyphosphate kinase|nr:polyphosphate kinase 1 [Treponema sp.]